MEGSNQSDPFKTRATLIQKLKDPNDNEAWERFVNTYNAFIFSVIYRMRLQSSDAEEVSQKVSLKVWNSLPKSEEEIKSFRSWLAKITHNAVLDFIRERKTRQSYHDQYAEKKEVEYLESIKVFKSDEIEDREWEIFLISKAMSRLSGSFQEQALEIFKRRQNGESTQDIATSLNLKQNSVQRSFRRVRDRLVAEIALLKQEFTD